MTEFLAIFQSSSSSVGRSFIVCPSAKSDAKVSIALSRMGVSAGAPNDGAFPVSEKVKDA